MISNEEIMSNKEEIIKLLRKVQRPGIEELINYLSNSDFFTAPASPKLFRNYEGGLAEQALVRYEILDDIIKFESLDIPEESKIIAAILANSDRIDYFEITVNNIKKYSPNGSKYDGIIGNYDWVSEKGYKIKDEKERFIFGTSGQNAERRITNYIPLTDEESAAIINLGVTYENPTFYTAPIYNKYPLACLLSVADSLATFVIKEVTPF